MPISRMVANAEVFALYRDESPQFVWNGWLSARRIGGEAVSEAPIENSDENRIGAEVSTTGTVLAAHGD